MSVLEEGSCYSVNCLNISLAWSCSVGGTSLLHFKIINCFLMSIDVNCVMFL